MNQKEEETSIFVRYVGMRHVICVLVGAGLFSGISMRFNFNIAMVSMVNFTELETTNRSTTGTCPLQKSNSTSSRPKQGEFFWDASEQGLLLGAFYYGYVITQIPGGFVSEKFGAKYILLAGIGVSSVLSFLTPVVARWSSTALFVVRFIMGFMQGPIFPSAQAILSKWSPSSERTTLVMLSYIGASLGIVAELPAGYLAGSDFLGGWPSVFYVFGLVGVVWAVAWVFLMYDVPEKHPLISSAEKKYIQSNNESVTKSKYENPPILKIIRSLPVWAMNISQLLEGYSMYVLLSSTPLYLREVLNFKITENGILSSLPNILVIPFPMIAGVLADRIRSRCLTTGTTRKLMTTLGDGWLMAALIGMAFADCRIVLILVLLNAGQALQGFAQAGAMVNSLDLAPRYAGTLYGVANCLYNFGGFLAPIIVSRITEGSANLYRWRIVFLSTAATLFVGIFVYIVFGQGVEQEWATQKEDGKQIIESGQEEELACEDIPVDSTSLDKPV